MALLKVVMTSWERPALTFALPAVGPKGCGWYTPLGMQPQRRGCSGPKKGDGHVETGDILDAAAGWRGGGQ